MNEPTTAIAATSEAHAAVIVSVLEGESIDCKLVRGDTLSSSVLDVGTQTPFIVEVRKEDVDRARQALQGRLAEFADFDWENADMGEPDDAVATRIAQSAPPPAGPNRLIQTVTVLIIGFVFLSIITIVIAAVL